MKNKFSCLLVAIISIIIIFSFSIGANFTIVSYGNSNDKAIVKKVYNTNEQKIYTKYSNYDFIKADNISSKKKVSYKELSNIITSSNKQGLIYGISFDKNFENFLLSEEINSSNIVDYTNGTLNIAEINKILIKKGKQLLKLPKYFYIFKTESKYYENGYIKLTNTDGFNMRDISLDNVFDIANDASLTLANMNDSSGKYEYGYYIDTAEQINDYNILRHAGSTWSLILEYKINPSKELAGVIKRSIKYIVDNNLVSNDEDKIYVYEQESDEIKLGGCALTLLMLSEYMETFNDFEYLNTSKGIANAIIGMQKADGSFTHVLEKDLSIKEEYRTVYYDGESTYAILKLYGITKNSNYIEAVEKSFDYFINNNFESYHDHWISHSLDEYSKYKINDKYVSFALLNYTYNSDNIISLNSFNPTGLELLTSTYSLYSRVLKENKELVSGFDIDKLKSDIDNRTIYLLQRYTYPEVAMYYKNPSISMNAFYSKEDYFRLRIDDIQHSIVGLIFYYDLFQKNQA